MLRYTESEYTLIPWPSNNYQGLSVPHKTNVHKSRETATTHVYNDFVLNIQVVSNKR
jgi:hypothetical protein